MKSASGATTDGGGGGGGDDEEDPPPATSSSPSRKRVPLKTILQNFLNHVSTLEAQKHEGENTYEKEFQQLKTFSDSLRQQGGDYACLQGEKEVNRKKNRYKDILPFDSTRVLLSDYPGVPGSDYINANYIKGASGSNAYIASQGPLPHTVNDFWRMVVETEVQVIVMACNETEAGKHKCEKYWFDGDDDEASAAADGSSPGCPRRRGSLPPEGGPEKQFGKFFLRVLKMREICPDFLVRTMRLRWTSDDGREEERTVCQFHYSAWPDHGIPTQVKPLLEMVRLIRDCQASETLPVLIHCSAGCGRTGTICAIDFIWGLLRTGKLTSDFSLFELVRDMRKQRIAMVQTVDQYILVHRAVRELFLEQMRVIDAHPYENVDGDGNPIVGGKYNPEEITPEYETIFVKSDAKGEHDIDKILTQRISQQQQQLQPRTVMGTAMLSNKDRSPAPGVRRGSALGVGAGTDSSQQQQQQTPPEPPPKQKNLVDSKAIETKRIDIKSGADSSSDLAPIESFTKPPTPERVLLEPAKAPEVTKDAAAQRYKKGNLRLTKTDTGGWKLEEKADEEKEVVINKPSQVKKESKKKKKGKDEEGSRSELMRKPSMKKIRAFFSKDKDSSSSSSAAARVPPVRRRKTAASESSSSGDESPLSDPEIASALSKLPKFRPAGGAGSSELAAYKNSPNSKSVPNLLDRELSALTSSSLAAAATTCVREPNYANVEKRSNRMFWQGDDDDQFVSSASTKKSFLKSSQSSERLAVVGGVGGAGGRDRARKPSLPIKRSKSMKAVTKPVSSSSIHLGPDDASTFHNLERRHEQSQRSSFNKGSSNGGGVSAHRKPPLPNSSSDTSFQSLPAAAAAAGGGIGGAKDKDYYSSPRHSRQTSADDGGGADYANMRLQPHKTSPSSAAAATDYVNVRVQRGGGGGDGDFFDQQVSKLNSQIAAAESDSSSLTRRIESDHKPLADTDAKRMLKDCQEYLMSRFDRAEREGERLLQQNSRPLPSQLLNKPPSKNRSAESSPMTTLQKSNAHLFSSHSSPSNSYNKYSSHGSGGKVVSPPGTILKSVSSPTGTIQKSFCSPADGAAMSGDSVDSMKKTSPAAQARTTSSAEHSPLKTASPPKTAAKDLPDEPGGRDQHEYANIRVTSQPQQQKTDFNPSVAVEAQRKLSEAMVSTEKGSRARERRNSFREAVDKSKSQQQQHSGAPPPMIPKKSYESIWLNQQQQLKQQQLKQQQQQQQQPSDPSVSPRKSPRSSENSPRKMSTVFVTSTQKAQPQARPSATSTRSPPKHAHQQPPPRKTVISGNYDNVPIINDTGYEPIQFQDGQMVQNQPHSKQQQLPATATSTSANERRPSTAKQMLFSHGSQGLQSVGLVAEVLKGGGAGSSSDSDQSVKGGVINKKSQPPPYKEPPQPSKILGKQQQQQQQPPPLPVHHKRSSPNGGLRGSGGGQRGSAMTIHPHQLNQFISNNNNNNNQKPPELPAKENQNAYVNVQQQQQQQRRPSAANSSDATPKRHSRDAGLNVKPLSASSSSEAPTASPPGIDLDTVAAMMHNRGNPLLPGGTNPPGSSKPLGRTLAGVLSGAAANLRSKFSNLSSTSVGGGGGGGSGEAPAPAVSTATGASPSLKTEAGASSSSPSSSSSSVNDEAALSQAALVGKCSYTYPHRLEVRPRGSRDPPAHFQRKQEYL